jgi:hypothetical protein
MSHRFREQARSHILIAFLQKERDLFVGVSLLAMNDNSV